MAVNAKNNRRAMVPGDVRLAIGARLQEARGSALQSDFADQMGLTQPIVSNYERGLVPEAWLTLRRLVEAGINANWLLTGQGKPQRNA